MQAYIALGQEEVSLNAHFTLLVYIVDSLSLRFFLLQHASYHACFKFKVAYNYDLQQKHPTVIMILTLGPL